MNVSISVFVFLLFRLSNSKINLVTDEVFDSSTSCVLGLRRVTRFQALLPSELIRHLRATIRHGLIALLGYPNSSLKIIFFGDIFLIILFDSISTHLQPPCYFGKTHSGIFPYPDFVLIQEALVTFFPYSPLWTAELYALCL